MLYARKFVIHDAIAKNTQHHNNRHNKNYKWTIIGHKHEIYEWGSTLEVIIVCYRLATIRSQQNENCPS